MRDLVIMPAMAQRRESLNMGNEKYDSFFKDNISN